MPGTLIVGSGGRLGAALLREWKAAGESVSGVTHSELDLADFDAVESTLGSLDFDVLVNCAAQTNVDRCETHPEEAQRINAAAVRKLGEICAARSVRCIHISTDYVFDGDKRSPYTEEDAARPISVYGESKRQGEIALAEVCEDHLVARVSWVFGPDRPSFVDQILQRAQEQEKVEAIGDKWAVPTYTLDVARYLRPLLREIPERGLLHVCNSGGCTWQEYGQFALDCAQKIGVPLKATAVGALRMADLKAFIARRPPYTVMDTGKLASVLKQEPRPWQDAVSEYLQACLVR